MLRTSWVEKEEAVFPGVPGKCPPVAGAGLNKGSVGEGAKKGVLATGPHLYTTGSDSMLSMPLATICAWPKECDLKCVSGGEGWALVEG